MALLAIVGAVNLLLQSTPREQLLPAIMQLIKPLSTQHMRERIAVRVLLSIEAVSQVQSLATDLLRQHPLTTRKFTTIARSSRLLYKNVLDRAALAAVTPIEVNEPVSPPWWQWVIPLAMSGLILVVV
jgi:endonuclease/exonuclease/phosphatase (EEP) superfamily protein YafD